MTTKRRLALLPVLCAVGAIAWLAFSFSSAATLPNLGPISNADEAVEKVNQLLISKVGLQFFRTYINFKDVHYDTGAALGEQWRGVYPGVYRVVYDFNMPQYEFVDDEIIEIGVTPDGDVFSAFGIPDPRRSVFISEAEAIAIARAAGLEEGIEVPEGVGSRIQPLMTSFNYHAGVETYVWCVENTTHVGDMIGGESMLIDAHSGEVLDRANWSVTPGYFPPAPVGMAVSVLAEAVYVDDDGRRLRGAGYDNLGVAGVEITVTDEDGSSQAVTTAAVPQGRAEPVVLDMLSGHTYTITASFNNSSSSVQATVKGRYSLDHTEHRMGGFINVEVFQSSNTVRGVSYSEPVFI